MNLNFEQAIQEATEAMNWLGNLRGPVEEQNFAKVLEAFSNHRVSDMHLKGSTGYGYDDVGRDTLEQIYAQVFKTEAALMRQQIISGTHAITLALMGNLLPKDELLYVGTPYDTLHKVIGHKTPTVGSMVEQGIRYREVDFNFEAMEPNQIVAAIAPCTKIVAIQRSKGYNWRKSLLIRDLEKLISAIKKAYPQVIVFVDNCYGEFVEATEPTEVGADLMAGSLIKNPGGGLAPSGGYIVGRQDLIERSAARLTAPGLGKEVGPSLMDQRLFYQGFFMAPTIVGEAVRSGIFTAALLQALGFPVLPKFDEERGDIIQAIQFGREDLLLSFCQGIQRYAPVDSFVTPIPWDMPGYSNQIIMAAGAFIQGSSIELSADAPVIAPYNVYFQGGLSRYHGKIAVTNTIQDMIKAKLL